MHEDGLQTAVLLWAQDMLLRIPWPAEAKRGLCSNRTPFCLGVACSKPTLGRDTLGKAGSESFIDLGFGPIR